jgi:UDP-3-O-[3-hydroxymyristoyl] glucosamine N-acyltransferase
MSGGRPALALSLEEVLRLTQAHALGSPPARFTGIRTLEEAGPGDISIYSSPRYRKAFEATRAGAVLAPEATPEAAHTALLLVANPTLALARLLDVAFPVPRRWIGIAEGARVDAGTRVAEEVSIHAGAFVGPGCEIGRFVTLHPGATVMENCQIGEGCDLFPHVVLYPGTVLGRGVRIHAGSVIGSDGFGYVHDGRNHVKVPQVGRVRVEDGVEIGACCTVDRATLGETVIGAGTKMDNLVQIGHNVVIGKQCVIVAQAAVAGSTRLGDGVVLGGQSGISGHLHLEDGARVAGGSGVTNGVEAGATVSGYPAMPHRDWLRLNALLRRMLKRGRE